MERAYWEKIAPDYNEEIFDVLRNDKKAIITSAIKKMAGASKTVMDAGCAIGKWLPVLSPAFKKVIAADISAKNLVIARKKYPGLTNVEYLRADMSGKAKLPKCDAIVCINAILTASLKKRNQFFSNLSSSLKKGGQLLLVVPSLESWLLTRLVQNRWKIDRQLFNDKFSAKEGLKKYINLQQGNADIDHVATKHYLREELMWLLSRERFIIEDCQKIEYDWTTEFVNPPAWLQKPGPWDWMFVARKK